MRQTGRTNYDDFKAEILSKPNIRKEYNHLIPKYEFIKMMIRRRNELKLSQSQVAQMIGTRQPAISRLESGNCNSRIGTLYRVADVLGLDISFKVRESANKQLTKVPV